jgi:hypothetical protein
MDLNPQNRDGGAFAPVVSQVEPRGQVAVIHSRDAGLQG